MGIAREQARKDLTLSTYTEAYWKIDLHNLLHFLALRMDEHAQYEIRQYATVIGEKIVSRWVPLAWEAFLDYRVNALELSRQEQTIIQELAAGNPKGALKAAKEYEWVSYENGKLKANIERAEMEEKLSKLNFRIPWPESE